MSDLESTLSAMKIRTSSPDGDIAGELTDRSNVQLTFHGESYYEYSDTTISFQLARLIEKLMDGRRRGYQLAVSEAAGRSIEEVHSPIDDRDRKFRALRDEAAVAGTSNSDHIEIFSTGLRDFRVEVPDSALNELSEAEFVAEFSSAVSDLWRDYSQLIRTIRRDVYATKISNAGV